MLLQTNRLIVGVCAGHRPCPASGRGISPHMTALPPPSERCVGLSAVPASRNVPDFSLYKNRRRIAATCSALTECDIFCTFCARLERSLMFARSARGKPRQPSMSESVQAVWKGWLFAVATIRCPRPTSPVACRGCRSPRYGHGRTGGPVHSGSGDTQELRREPAGGPDPGTTPEVPCRKQHRSSSAGACPLRQQDGLRRLRC